MLHSLILRAVKAHVMDAQVVIAAIGFSVFHLDSSTLVSNCLLGSGLGIASLLGRGSLMSSAMPHAVYNTILLILAGN